jgi:hypothetical protein
MGSASSGRRDGKPLVEDCLRLDLAQLMRLGPMRDGIAGDGWLEWRQDAQRLGRICFRIDLRQPSDARLVLEFRAGQGEAAAFRQSIGLAFTVPNYGGRRWWLICPDTGRRVRCLYLPPGGARFTGRKALGLAYRVERLEQFDRPFARLHRQRRKLAGGHQPMRPKGMWQRSYDQRLAALVAADAACLSAIAAKIGAPLS